MHMGGIDLALWVLFWGGCLTALGVFLFYPLLLYCLSFFIKNDPYPDMDEPLPLPFVSVLVVFRNADTLLSEKIDNFLAMDYPEDRLELILVSDGSQDRSKDIAGSATSERIRFHHFEDHLGKIHCLNHGVGLCQGEIIVFSDVDALVEPYVLEKLVAWFRDPDIGGVCGQRVVREKVSQIESGQQTYIRWDSVIKQMEVRVGQSVTSHDGKLYAIRKSLFRTVPPGVTDDAYISLTVTGQGFSFAFDPAAMAYIRMPSRSVHHELTRRRRIVSTSLRGLWLNRMLFNPFRYGAFSAGLFINKVMRRLLPVALIVVFLSSLGLALSGRTFYGAVFITQVAGYLFCLLYPWLASKSGERSGLIRKIVKVSGLGYFFCVGMAGTFLGMVSFLSGEEITKWDPVKK
ncbi:MAG: glycosyltransferase [Desulfobacterales bacterium]|nr:glycosyltransferase [Desulfobacterales bacterium]